MARLTPRQERMQHVERVLTPSIVKLIRESSGTIEAKSWAIGLGVSGQTIGRIRAGDRGATRKPMGGDRRSGRYL